MAYLEEPKEEGVLNPVDFTPEDGVDANHEQFNDEEGGEFF